MIIRPATFKDIDQMVELGLEMHQESRFKLLEYHPDKTALSMRLMLDKPDHLVLVAEIDGLIIGGFAGYALEHWCSHDRVAGDYFLFISQQFRGGTLALRLVRAYMEWAQEQGVKRELIGLGISTGVLTARTQRLYERLGFEATGTLMHLRGI